MIKAIILDLDDTLIDTRVLEPLRQARRWRDVRNHLKHCSVNEDVLGLLTTARSAGIKTALFTNAPSNYVQELLRHFDIAVDTVVAYHDVKQHKPSAEGVHKILELFSAAPHEALYLGDSELDRGAAQSAGVEFFAVEWGSVPNIDAAHQGVAKLSELIGDRLAKENSNQSRSELLIDGNKIYLGYYLEGIKQEVWAFKDGSISAINRWVSKATELTNIFPEIDFVVRALGHAELSPEGRNKPLDRLSRALARSLDARYVPEALIKNRVLQKSTGINSAERLAQVHGAYSLKRHAAISSFKQPRFLVVDDVFTSGATTGEIQRAITEAYPTAQVFVFTLVKTLYRYAANRVSLELQHNNQLFSDLFSQQVEPHDIEAEHLPSNPSKRRVVSKKFSANYTNTNHNFVAHNLPLYSIASEANFEQLYASLQILKNILQRGKPTIASRRLRNSFGLAVDETGLNLEPLPLISSQPVRWQRLIRGDQKSGKYPAKFFFEELFQKHLGNYGFVKQLTVPEVQIFDMTQVYVDQFQNRQVDFYIPQVGVIIEIDGAQHHSSTDIDRLRDDFAASLGLRTFRFTAAEVSVESDAFIDKMKELTRYIELIDHQEQDGTIAPPNGITIRDYAEHYAQSSGFDTDQRLQLTASCRFQLLILELIERGAIRLGQSSKVKLVNNDQIDFVLEAVEDLNELIANIFCLQGLDIGALKLEIEELDTLPSDRDSASLFIDFSIRERFDDRHQVNQDVIFVRTDYFDFYRVFPSGDSSSIKNLVLEDYDHFKLSCAKPVEYELDLSPASAQRESLRYFLSNLFLPLLDDVDFREGQVGIVGSALSRHSTIGLLPTGSGKSICYQLSAVLQPAVSFVICPIKSLMYDQKADLDAIGFSRSNYITSELSAGEKSRVQRDFGRGKYFYVFISPERFQTHAFRREMSSIGLDLAFAYAVIDEAHCLSEWGHDFRTSYLNLANTIEKFAPTASYIGLTATASVNVLKDIQTEFSIPDEYIRTPLNFTRDELAFHVIDDEGRKADVLVELVASMEEKWNLSGKDSDGKAGIIFTSTVNGNKGCHSLSGRLSTLLGMDVRYFSGSAPKGGGLHGEAFDRYKRQVQDDFKDNKYHLLAATKAFGMGVNKGNVAYTIHYGIPESMEALYQEAGRAGRDKRLFQSAPADCFVLLTKEADEQLLEKIWAQSTSVTDLKGYVKSLNRNGDLNTNMSLMTANLDTINDEFKLLAKIYNHLYSNQELKIVTLSARQFGVEKAKFEKAIYRLSQLGIVSDWVIEDFFNGTLEIEFQCPDIDSLESNIEDTVRKYDPAFKLEDIFASDNEYYKVICERLNRGSIDKAQFIFLVLLLWSYDHFVYNRRQSQKNVYDECVKVAGRGASAEAAFKVKLEGYFRHDKSSQRLLHLAENSADTVMWLSVFYKDADEEGSKELISESELNTLSAQISRFLESYKDNQCLDYLSGLVRLAADQFDDMDGEIRMSASLDKVINASRVSALTLIRETLCLKTFFSDEARSRFARLVNEKFGDPQLLEEINQEFRDSYSYHTLLSPLADRLQRLTSSYKGVDW